MLRMYEKTIHNSSIQSIPPGCEEVGTAPFQIRVHKTKIVKEYLKKRKRWLTVEYLPPYAPELNPTEYVWSSRKRKEFGNAVIPDSHSLDRRIRECGKRARGDPRLLKGFLKASSLFK